MYSEKEKYILNSFQVNLQSHSDEYVQNRYTTYTKNFLSVSSILFVDQYFFLCFHSNFEVWFLFLVVLPIT